jgi:hypothetical protein
MNGRKKSSRCSLMSERTDQDLKNSQKSILETSKQNEEVHSLPAIPQSLKEPSILRNHSSLIQPSKPFDSKTNKKSASSFFNSKNKQETEKSTQKPSSFTKTNKKSILSVLDNVQTPTFDDAKMKVGYNLMENNLNGSLNDIPEESPFPEKRHSSMVLSRNEAFDDSQEYDNDYSGDSLSEPDEEVIFSETFIGKKEVNILLNKIHFKIYIFFLIF